MPTPFFRPTISAASTAIQAAKKLMRSMVNTCGSTAGKITQAQTCACEAPKVRAVLIRRWSTDCTAATVESVSRKYTPVNTTNTAVGLPMPNTMMPTGIQAIGAIGARPRTIGSSAATRARHRHQDAGGHRGDEAEEQARHHAERARQDRRRDRHALLAEADAEVALDREADERRRRREQRGRHPAARRRELP